MIFAMLAMLVLATGAGLVLPLWRSTITIAAALAAALAFGYPLSELPTLAMLAGLGFALGKTAERATRWIDEQSDQ